MRILARWPVVNYTCVRMGGAGTSYSLSEARPRAGARFGLLDFYLIRGIAGPFAVIFAAVTIALMLERALRLIHELAASGADIGYFLPLLGQLVPYYLELAVPLAFMAALMLLVARLDERLELEALLASGVSLARIAAPLVAFGLVLAALALAFGGWLEPHGRHGFRSLRAEAVNAGRLGDLPPLAVFQPGDDLAVTYDSRGADGTMHGVFLWQRLPGGEELVVSGGSGRVGFDTQARVFGIDFDAGRYVSENGADAYSLDFRSMAFRQSLQLRESSWERGSDPKELTLSELAAELGNGARGHSRRQVEIEIYGRIARALIVPLLPFLVLPLAFATKKGGRALGVFLCGAFVALSRHLVGLAKNFAEMGWGPPPLLFATTIGGVGLLATLLFVSARKLPSHSPIHSLLNPVSKAFARLEPRTRAVPGLRGHALMSYVSWEVGKWTLLALGTIALLLQMIDVVEQGEVFVQRGLGLADVGRYAALRFPAIVQQSVPIAALTGAMAAFALLASRHEITAIRASGLSQWRVLAMSAPVALALLAATFALAEWATPASQVRLAAWWQAGEPATEKGDGRARWFRLGRDIIRVGAASPDGMRLANVQIFSRDGDGRIEQRLAAEEASHGVNGWSLSDVEVSRFSADTIHRIEERHRPWGTSLLPEDATSFFAAAPIISAETARRSLAQAAPIDRAEAVFATRVQRSGAEPLAPLVMLLLALPLAFVPPRTGRAWPALLYAGVGGLVYLVADGVLTVAAQVGYVHSVLGAWAAPVLAGLVGLGVLLFSER
jgi:LPS export ABC transporter permease LptG